MLISDEGDSMNTNVIFQITTVILVLILAAILIAVYVIPEGDTETKLNDDLKDSIPFDVVDDYTGSSMKGSIITAHTGKDTEITLLAHIDITSVDEGPVLIYLDKELLVKSAITDYNGDVSGRLIEYIHVRDKINFLQIGSFHPKSFDKGSGELEVKLILNDQYSIPDEVSLTISVGNKINDDGTYQNGLTTKDFTIGIWS